MQNISRYENQYRYMHFSPKIEKICNMQSMHFKYSIFKFYHRVAQIYS